MLGRKPVSSRPPVRARVLRRFASACVPPKGCRGEAGGGRIKNSQVFGALIYVSLLLLNIQQLLQFRFRTRTGEENSSGAVFEVRALRVANIQAPLTEGFFGSCQNIAP
jgi:hypothetical protein